MTNNDELRAYEISNQLRHLADNEIDSDSFAVVIENYNGREVDFERPITELAFEAAELVDALLAERDADKKRIAELEARTVSVKLPKTIWYEHDDLARDVAVLEKRLVKKALREACADAGIKLEVGE